MSEITLYTANCKGKSKNCEYPNRVVVSDEKTLKAAIAQDFVCCEYKNNHRSNENFIRADCVPMDLDNTHSDEDDEWDHPMEVADKFLNVEFYFAPSRNHLKAKDGKAPRPKGHYFFPLREPILDSKKYSEIKTRIQKCFPHFDGNALDSGRFYFGTDARLKEVQHFNPNGKKIDEFLEEEGQSEEIKLQKYEASDDTSDTEEEREEDFDADMESGTYGDQPIPQGQRHNTMTRLASVFLKKYGDTETARTAYEEAAERCEPPLGRAELNGIWKSQRKWWKKEVASKPDYVPPEDYQTVEEELKEVAADGKVKRQDLKPADYTDLGQAVLIAKTYKKRLLYTAATGFLVYDKKQGYWEKSTLKAQKLIQDLTSMQLERAKTKMLHAKKLREKYAITAKTAKEETDDKQTAKIISLIADAEELMKFTLKQRDSRRITASMKEVAPMIEINPQDLDKAWYYLNTPSWTIDLRTGEKKEHDPSDHITKQTAVDPSDEGAELWQAMLDTVFPHDQTLQDYVRLTMGLALYGKVFQEEIHIPYGEGRNGKSTFYNTIKKVLNTYAGGITTDALLLNKNKNVMPDYAELRGLRLVIASEIDNLAQLSTARLKQLASTDAVRAEEKFKAPFEFTPTHTLVLPTNHLPTINTTDEGTWRRLTVIPFVAKIEGDNDIKNYAEYLFEHCGGAILAWLLKGAREACDKNYRIEKPDIVKKATGDYRESNDQVQHFLDERCETGTGTDYEESSGKLLEAYRSWCKHTGERAYRDFYTILERKGFTRRRTGRMNIICGLRVVENLPEEFTPEAE